MYFPSESAPDFKASFLPKLEMVQNIKRIVKALARADMKLTILAISVTSVVNIAKKAPNIWKRGAPGGWPTSSLMAVEIYSPTSQELTVGSMVNV